MDFQDLAEWLKNRSNIEASNAANSTNQLEKCNSLGKEAAYLTTLTFLYEQRLATH